MDGLGISDLAGSVGVAPSTVRYYERIGLVPEPARTTAGYRRYGADAQARLRFIVRGKRLGLSLEQIAKLLGVWDGTNCAATQEHLSELLDVKQAEIDAHVGELRRFSQQLSEVRERLLATDAPESCSPELDCCTPGLLEPSEPPEPIACTLDGRELETRLAEFDTLFHGALIAREHTDAGIRFRFANREGLEADARDLAARELECCSFFRFTISVVGDEVWWDASVSDAAADEILEELFSLPVRRQV